MLYVMYYILDPKLIISQRQLKNRQNMKMVNYVHFKNTNVTLTRKQFEGYFYYLRCRLNILSKLKKSEKRISKIHPIFM